MLKYQLIKTIFSRFSRLVFTIALVAQTVAAPGDLDTTFGAGKVFTHIQNSDYANAVAVQTDGKIVVAGNYYNGTDWDIVVTRYNLNGALDISFSGDGINGKSLNGGQSANGIVIQPDGKIVVVGEDNTSVNNSQFAIARYNTNGEADLSFDGDGYQTVDAGALGRHDIAHGVSVQSDGKIVVVGWSYNSVDRQEFSVVRLNSNGSLDSSFSGSGRRMIDVGGTNDIDVARSVVIAAGR